VVPVLLIRVAIALVWLYEGLWCKVLGRMPNQQEVLASHPMFRTWAKRALFALGLLEVAIAVWVLSGLFAWEAALFQTVLLVTMNANGLLFARHAIFDPGGMVVKNFSFLVLIWVAAYAQ
jgi:uncharacterized membrane protein YphA (DoxX/SURF4 family)